MEGMVQIDKSLVTDDRLVSDICRIPAVVCNAIRSAPAFCPPARPCVLCDSCRTLLSHGLAYEDRDEGIEVCDHEGKGHEGNEGRQIRGMFFFKMATVVSLVFRVLR